MKNTNTSAFRAIVYRYLLDSIYSEDCPATDDKSRAEYIFYRFQMEYNYPDNIRRIPNTQARVAEWLSGLALNIEYTYCDIIKRTEIWHECKLTDKEADTVIEQWFTFLAMKLIQLWRVHGLGV